MSNLEKIQKEMRTLQIPYMEAEREYDKGFYTDKIIIHI